MHRLASAGEASVAKKDRVLEELGSWAGFRRTTSISLLQDSVYGSCSTGDTHGKKVHCNLACRFLAQTETLGRLHWK